MLVLPNLTPKAQMCRVRPLLRFSRKIFTALERTVLLFIGDNFSEALSLPGVIFFHSTYDYLPTKMHTDTIISRRKKYDLRR